MMLLNDILHRLVVGNNMAIIRIRCLKTGLRSLCALELYRYNAENEVQHTCRF